MLMVVVKFLINHTVNPVFNGHCDEGYLGTLSQNGVISSPCIKNTLSWILWCPLKTGFTVCTNTTLERLCELKQLVLGIILQVQATPSDISCSCSHTTLSSVP